MLVLLVGQTPRRFGPDNFQWLNDTAQGLRRLGHTVRTVSYRDSVVESPLLRNALLRMPALSHRLSGYGDGLRRTYERRLVMLARRLRPDLVIVLKGEILSGETLSEVKRLARGPVVTWWVDDPWRYPSCLQQMTLFDHVFIFDRSYMPRLAAAGVSRVHFLPCGCNDLVYRPLRLNHTAQRRFACDVSFVAWGYPGRSEVVQALAREVDLGVWGGGWNGLRWQRTVRGHAVIRGPSVSSRTAVKIYNASKIGLNVHQAQSRSGGLNTRTFELPASGLFQIVDRVGGLEELLAPGVEVVCYGSPEEARELARRYLADESARTHMARRARARVLEEHTYLCRMRTLCEVARG